MSCRAQLIFSLLGASASSSIVQELASNGAVKCLSLTSFANDSVAERTRLSTNLFVETLTVLEYLLIFLLADSLWHRYRIVRVLFPVPFWRVLIFRSDSLREFIARL